MVQRDLHLLPREILVEILSRLPITSLIHFKTTSHTCYDLIADPRLPWMFHERVSASNPCLILFNYSLSQQLHFVDIEDCSRRVRKIEPPQHLKIANLVGACNGLLCFSFPIISDSFVSHGLLIYNPFVGDAVRVPPAVQQFFYQFEVFGFGFHPRTGEFKVVRIVYYAKEIMVGDPVLDVEELDERFDTVEESMVQVFTVGTTEWRNKGAPPPQLGCDIGPTVALVEGSLHWVTAVGMGGVDPVFGIISFDLAAEVFEEIPHPPCQRLVSDHYNLSVLSGCSVGVYRLLFGQFKLGILISG
ncbi:hypothetical protein SLE2022_321340 [Rubroshorea leprosula]